MLYHYLDCSGRCKFLGGFGQGLNGFGHDLENDDFLDYRYFPEYYHYYNINYWE